MRSIGPQTKLRYDRCQKLDIRLGCRDEKQGYRVKLGWKIEKGKGKKRKAALILQKEHVLKFS